MFLSQDPLSITLCLRVKLLYLLFSDESKTEKRKKLHMIVIENKIQCTRKTTDIRISSMMKSIETMFR